MLDDALKPWLLEVNHTPSFTADTPLDLHIKKNLILDTLCVVDVSHNNKKK
jgi:tubulin polyglutamylase TTLL6/13